MPEITRTRPPEDADERSTLTGLLDFLRSTVELKLSGLTEQQAFARPVGPSALTPAGIVKHLTAVERFWFSIDFAGLDLEWPWSEDDPHGCFPIAPDDTVEGILTAYRTECARSREITAAASFDDKARSDGCRSTSGTPWPTSSRKPPATSANWISSAKQPTAR